jgi:hypothetical protein
VTAGRRRTKTVTAERLNAARTAALNTGSRPAKKSADESGTGTCGSVVIRGSSGVDFCQYTVAISAVTPDAGSEIGSTSP